MKELEQIRREIKKQLDKYRYHHTLGVMYTAAALAMHCEISLEDAMTAGLLHDCAKCIPNDIKIELCKKYEIALTETELQNTALIHPKLGAYLAKSEYGIEKQEIIDAIAYHTTGRPDMTMLEKIIYVADYIEPGRGEAPNLPYVRKLAFENIDQAMYKILDDTLEYLNTRGGVIDPMTEKTRRYYKNLTQEGGILYGTS